MILEGNERGHAAEIARHLLNPRDNDHVTVHAIDGFVAEDLAGALAEVAAISQATQCQNYLFSLSLNPPPEASVPVAVFEETITAIEAKLGLAGQPRAIVFHEKNGRRHAHCVWSRIDAGALRAINLSHYKRKLCDLSRELYRTHEWEVPAGFLDSEARDPLRFDRIEAAQAKRAKADPKALKAMFRGCWARSDSRAAFAAALWENGYALARGDRRGFVAVDRQGKAYSLSRWCGVKPKELRARLGPEDGLWSVEEARAALIELDAPDPAPPRKAPDATAAHRRMLLVQRQRQERAALKEHQEKRRIQALNDRQARLPKGLRAAWSRVTGQYQRLVKTLAAEATQADNQDAQDLQALIERHLTERRALERQQAEPDLVAELTATFETATRPDPRQPLILQKDDIPFSQSQLMADPALILGYVSHEKARFDRTDVLRDLAKRITDPMTLSRAADRAMTSPTLVNLGTDARPSYTTKDYQTAERALDLCAAKMAATNGFTVAIAHIHRAILRQDAEMNAQFGGALSQEQHAALRHILGPTQLASVVGLAGAGKSTMLKTAHEAWTRQGVTVHGAALSGKAAAGLEDSSGITSRTLASLEASWETGSDPIAPGDVLVVDEAGMIGTRQIRRVTEKIAQIGAKLVLVGDPDQLQPIEAGKPFRRLVETHGAARLTEIHRQRTEWQRQASRDLAAGKVTDAVQRYAQKGAVTQRRTQDSALAALVEDYLADSILDKPDITRLAFTHRRKDVYRVNQAIRAALRSAGDASPEVLIETETGPRAFAAGDRIVFTRNDKTLGVKNGMLGTVIRATDGQISVDLDSEDRTPAKVHFNPKRYNAIDHGYAVTIHKSQGATIDKAYVLASRSMDNPLSYVAMTRHRDAMKLYVSEKDRPDWAKPQDRGRTQVNRPRSRGPSR